MSSTQKGLLGLTLLRIQTLRKNNSVIPPAITEQYRQLAAAEGSPNTIALAELLHSEALADDGRYVEALLVMDAALRAQPDNLRLNTWFHSVLYHVTKRVESLGELRPESAEFGRAYELLMTLGNVSLSMHVSAVYHYALMGGPREALQLAARIRNRAPHCPGLDEAIAMTLQRPEEK